MHSASNSDSTNYTSTSESLSFGCTLPTESQSSPAGELSYTEKYLEEINDALYEISSDMYILTAYQGLESWQKAMFYQKIEKSLGKVYTYIQERENIGADTSAIDLLLYDQLGILQQMMPDILTKMPKFKSFIKKMQRTHFTK